MKLEVGDIVYVVDHIFREADYKTVLKRVGVYKTKKEAEEAVEAKRDLEEYADDPDGFVITRRTVVDNKW